MVKITLGGQQGPGRLNKSKTEFHPLCRRWHALDQCGLEGQLHRCSNCKGGHHLDKYRQHDKVIRLSPLVANIELVGIVQ